MLICSLHISSVLCTMWGWKTDETTLSSRGSHPGEVPGRAQRRKRDHPRAGTRELPCHLRSLKRWMRFEQAEMDKGAFQEKKTGLEPWSDHGTVSIGDTTEGQRELNLGVGT